MVQIVAVRPLPGYKLHLKYADGVEGPVDLSNLVGQGVFSIWNDPQVFEKVRIGSSGELAWNDEVDLCPDALYLELTGKSPEELFPNLKKAQVNA